MKPKNKNEDTCKNVADYIEDVVAGKADETLSEYFEREEMDITYLVSGSGKYEGVRSYVTINSPAICVDTEKEAVCINTGFEKASWGLSKNASDAVDAYYEEIFEDRMFSRYGR